MQLIDGRKVHDRRRNFIGGSDARIIMGSDETALVRLWREKRGEVDPEDLSGNLIVQLGTATEELNRTCPRVMGVLRPLRVVIENFPEGEARTIDAPLHPENKSQGTRAVPFSRVLYVERDFTPCGRSHR